MNTLFAFFLFCTSLQLRSKACRAFVAVSRTSQQVVVSTTIKRISKSNNLVSVEECLALHHHANNTTNSATPVQFVDGSWYHKGVRNGRRDFAQGPRIPGSIYFDLDDIACTQELFPDQNPAGLSHMQPPPRLFAAYMQACGVTNDHHVIIYGRAGCSFLPRVWFTFRHVMGHTPVSLMQGSLEDWKEAGGPVDSEPLLDTAIPKAKDLDLEQRPRTMQYQVQSYNANAVVIDLQEMKAIVAGADNARQGNNDSSSFIILDPRGSSFAKGHMPGAMHVPYSTLSDPHNPNRIKPVQELRPLLQEALLGSKDKSIVLSCGSGVSVCSLYLALEECGVTTDTRVVVYDGSWEEWRAQSDVPKVALRTEQ